MSSLPVFLWWGHLAEVSDFWRGKGRSIERRAPLAMCPYQQNAGTSLATSPVRPVASHGRRSSLQQQGRSKLRGIRSNGNEILSRGIQADNLCNAENFQLRILAIYPCLLLHDRYVMVFLFSIPP